MESRKQNITQTAIHVPQGEGKSVWILDELLTFKVHDDQSETVGIFEDEVLPQSGPPAHLHRSQDETHYVLEGQFEFVIGERKFNAGVGSVVYVPRTTVHAFTNTGTQKGKLLFIETPAGALEQFLEEAGEPVSDPSSPPQGPPDLDKLLAGAQRTGGIEFVEAGP
ncbi:MAG TPA: cupin domain-containing protein [Rubrobacter sp.]|nr:cupin domain-containing protein [Rubrobacter sp.]